MLVSIVRGSCAPILHTGLRLVLDVCLIQIFPNWFYINIIRRKWRLGAQRQQYYKTTIGEQHNPCRMERPPWPAVSTTQPQAPAPTHGQTRWISVQKSLPGSCHHRPDWNPTSCKLSDGPKWHTFSQFLTSQKIDKIIDNCYFFTNVIRNKMIFWWLTKKFEG